MLLSLSLRGNVILDENALQCLALMSNTLQALVLSDNPLVETMDYRLNVLILMPQLKKLDKYPVSPEEKSEVCKRIKVKLRNISILFVTCSDKKKFSFSGCFNASGVLSGSSRRGTG